MTWRLSKDSCTNKHGCATKDACAADAKEKELYIHGEIYMLIALRCIHTVLRREDEELGSTVGIRSWDPQKPNGIHFSIVTTKRTKNMMNMFHKCITNVPRILKSLSSG